MKNLVVNKKCCNKCNVKKSSSEFYNHVGRKDGRSGVCIECEKKYKKVYRINNKKYLNYKSAKYYSDNKKEILKKIKVDRINNIEKFKEKDRKYYEKNKVIIRVRQKDYDKRNPEKIRAIKRRRRNLKNNTEGSHTEQEWQDKKKEYNYKCAYCGINECDLKNRYQFKKWHLLTEEHVTAISNNGSDYITNIVPACISCNTSKGSVRPKNYLVSGGTGSLGNVLIKKLLKRTDVNRIIVYARDEFKESEMQRSINNSRIKFYLGDVRDIDRLREVYENENIDITIHLSSFKRMDQSLHNVYEVSDVNIRGTRNIMLAGKNCEKVIFVSTDKAFEPQNIYGATKMIAESIVLASLNGIVWRFGNYIGSRGSVWEIFAEQKKQGVPFTITDLDATRFVIDMETVCDHLLSNVGHGLHYPKNLESMTVKEIADSIDPNHPYVITGLREGEKLHESFNENYTSENK